MNFKFTVNKWSNFYFFVQNLSEWHFSCRKNYNIFWQQQFGKLTTKEKKALENFNKIRLRYDQGKTCFEKSFFTKKNPWRSLSLTLTSKEYKVIYNIFSLFQNRFEKLYKEESPLLKKWKILLSKKANDQTLGKKIHQDFRYSLWHEY